MSVLVAQAQTQPAAAPAIARADPLDPKARVPAARYESAFAQFRRLGDEKPLAWREANDAVARIGGWRAYAREAHAAEPASAPAAAPAASAGHAAHPHGGPRHVP